MKLFKLIIVAALAIPLHAFGLADTSAPAKIQIPFGNSAGGAYKRTVPVASQIGIQNGAASYTDGFPPLNFTPVNAGGVPPFGQDMNGVLYDVSAHARWWAAGGPVYYDSAYQTAIGGYPKGACVQSLTTVARMWCSTVDNNTSNPDTGGANWQYPNDAVNAINATNATNSTNAVNLSGGTVAATTITGTTISGSSAGMPKFSVYANGNQNISGATKVNFGAETFDTNSNFDTGTGRFTPTVAGYYQVNFATTIFADSTSLTSANVFLYKNGSRYKDGVSRPVVAATTGLTLVGSDLVYMNGSTDYLEIYVTGTGTNPKINGNVASPWLTYFSGSLQV